MNKIMYNQSVNDKQNYINTFVFNDLPPKQKDYAFEAVMFMLARANVEIQLVKIKRNVLRIAVVGETDVTEMEIGDE